MNVYREKIMYNFRYQTYWDLCAVIAFCNKKKDPFMYKLSIYNIYANLILKPILGHAIF